MSFRNFMHKLEGKETSDEESTIRETQRSGSWELQRVVEILRGELQGPTFADYMEDRPGFSSDSLRAWSRGYNFNPLGNYQEYSPAVRDGNQQGRRYSQSQRQAGLSGSSQHARQSTRDTSLSDTVQYWRNVTAVYPDRPMGSTPTESQSRTQSPSIDWSRYDELAREHHARIVRSSFGAEESRVQSLPGEWTDYYPSREDSSES